MSAREEILRRLRATGEAEAPLPEIRAPIRITGDPVQLFLERAAAVGADVVRITSGGLAERVVRDLRRRGVQAVAVWEDPVLASVQSALRAEGVEILLPQDQTSTRVTRADAGVTTADYAIAETGTLVLTCSPLRPRSTSLLPPLHVAVLSRDRILPTLEHLFTDLHVLPSALTFITGPSRTADIELTPVQGVHGPVSIQVYVLG